MFMFESLGVIRAVVATPAVRIGSDALSTVLDDVMRSTVLLSRLSDPGWTGTVEFRTVSRNPWCSQRQVMLHSKSNSTGSAT